MSTTNAFIGIVLALECVSLTLLHICVEGGLKKIVSSHSGLHTLVSNSQRKEKPGAFTNGSSTNETTQFSQTKYLTE